MSKTVMAFFLSFSIVTLAGCCGFGLGGGVISPSLPHFPWPPPQASSKYELSDEFFRAPEKGDVFFRDVDKRLKDALEDAGYTQQSYYAVPGGFALVVRLEQINSDGTPKSGDDRWAVEVAPLRHFSLDSYLKALFTNLSGYFRIIVFVVTPYPFDQSEATITDEEAAQWIYRGINRLPTNVGDEEYTEQHTCTALIYEFEKQYGKEIADVLIPGRLASRSHLEKSAIMNGLRRQR